MCVGFVEQRWKPFLCDFLFYKAGTVIIYPEWGGKVGGDGRVVKVWNGDFGELELTKETKRSLVALNSLSPTSHNGAVWFDFVVVWFSLPTLGILVKTWRRQTDWSEFGLAGLGS